jgi:uncharacterized membrane protein
VRRDSGTGLYREHIGSERIADFQPLGRLASGSMKGAVGTHRASSETTHLSERIGVLWSSGGVVAMSTMVMAAIYATLILRKHAMFGTQVFDLGIFDQGVWLLSRFKTPFVTLRGLNLFADHASWILLPVAPLYWIWSDVRVLLLLTVAAVVAGGPLAYLIARTEGVRKPLAAALAVAYLLHPAVAWNVWDVFHPEVLAVPLLLAAYLFAARHHTAAAGAALLLALLVKEDAVLVVVPLALYLAWRFKAWRMAGIVIVGGVLLFIFNFDYALPHFSPTGSLIYTSRYGEFGNSMPEIAWHVLTSPGKVLSILVTPERLAYLAGMVLPLFLALMAPEMLLVAVPITLANMLSLHGYQYVIKYHYTVYLLAIVTLAAIKGAAHIGDRSERLVRLLVAGVLVGGVLGMFFAGPLPATDAPNPWAGGTSDPEAIDAALALIPSDGRVSSDWFIAPHTAHRTVIYMYPNPFIRDYWSADEAPGPPRDGADWVIMRTSTPGNSGEDKTAEALQMIEADPRFEQVVANDTVLLFHRVQ